MTTLNTDKSQAVPAPVETRNVLEEAPSTVRDDAPHRDEARELFPFPFVRTVSGLYQWTISFPLPVPQPPLPFPLPQPRIPQPPVPGEHAEATDGNGELPREDSAVREDSFLGIFRRSELRLDVDGRYPQMTASGTLFGGIGQVHHWIARLTGVGRNHWTGTIWYKDPSPSAFAYANVEIVVTGPPLRGNTSAHVTFSGGGAPVVTQVFNYVSPYFHQVEFEYDCAQGATPVTSVDTGAHPTRPATLPIETLTIETVYRRSGFDTSLSTGGNIVPLSLAGTNGTWSNQEMHDAMQVYWSHFAAKAQWAAWVFFAALHDMGTSLGGIMFDDIGPQQRQGTAIFENSFIAQAPAGDPQPAAWVQRMRYWTAVHEIGHTFNLAHSWQESLGNPWIPLADEPGAFSFMNYPYRVPPGPQNVFFQNFAFRFSDKELLFMRHAPFRFVEQGNALWFDHHGFEGAGSQPGSNFALELRTHRTDARFEFLEPVMVEVKLTNVSGDPALIPDNVMSTGDRMTIVVKRDGEPARLHLPYARYCFREHRAVLEAGDSRYEQLFLGAGRRAWNLSTPGSYTIQIALHLDGEDLVSNPLRLQIRPPRSFEEEHIAQDFFTDDVGRTLAFDGTNVFDRANNVLAEVVNRLPDRAVAAHARIALGTKLMRNQKQLSLKGAAGPATSAGRAGGKIVEVNGDPSQAKQQLEDALLKAPEKAAETLGHIDYHDYVDSFAQFLAKEGDRPSSAQVMNVLHDTLEARSVRKDVLADIKRKAQRYSRTT